jgi:hypothetical protein
MKLRFGSKLIFALFSVAVLSFTVTLIGGPPPAESQCNNSISTSSSKSVVYGFYAKGSGSGTQAKLRWYIDEVPQAERPQDKMAISGDWNHYTLSVTSISIPPGGQRLSVRVTFEAPSGQYAYISSTSFG